MTKSLEALCMPERIHRDWSSSIMRICEHCDAWKMTVIHTDGSAMCAGCCDDHYTAQLEDVLTSSLGRIAELEANQQKIESMSAFSDERLAEIERHRENSLLGHIPADLARELRQTRSRLGNYYSLLRRADIAESKVKNLSNALRANGISIEGGK